MTNRRGAEAMQHKVGILTGGGDCPGLNAVIRAVVRNIVMEAVDRLRTTAESHRRIMVIETMGRKAGWIACLSGIAVAADYILVPEVPVNLDHMCGVLQRRRAEGKLYGLVVVSEGAQLPESGLITSDVQTDEFGHVQLGGI